VFVDKGSVLDIISLLTLKKLGRSVADLVAINIQITSFIHNAIPILEVLISEVILGSRTNSIAFFIIERKPLYSVLLG
jgi:hypothetical protein